MPALSRKLDKEFDTPAAGYALHLISMKINEIIYHHWLIWCKALDNRLLKPA